MPNLELIVGPVLDPDRHLVLERDVFVLLVERVRLKKPTLLLGASRTGKSTALRYLTKRLPEPQRSRVVDFAEGKPLAVLEEAVEGLSGADVLLIDELNELAGDVAAKVLVRLAKLALDPEAPALVIASTVHPDDLLGDHPDPSARRAAKGLSNDAIYMLDLPRASLDTLRGRLEPVVGDDADVWLDAVHAYTGGQTFLTMKAAEALIGGEVPEGATIDARVVAYIDTVVERDSALGTVDTSFERLGDRIAVPALLTYQTLLEASAERPRAPERPSTPEPSDPPLWDEGDAAHRALVLNGLARVEGEHLAVHSPVVQKRYGRLPETELVRRRPAWGSHLLLWHRTGALPGAEARPELLDALKTDATLTAPEKELHQAVLEADAMVLRERAERNALEAQAARADTEAARADTEAARADTEAARAKTWRVLMALGATVVAAVVGGNALWVWQLDEGKQAAEQARTELLEKLLGGAGTETVDTLLEAVERSSLESWPTDAQRFHAAVEGELSSVRSAFAYRTCMEGVSASEVADLAPECAAQRDASLVATERRELRQLRAVVSALRTQVFDGESVPAACAGEPSAADSSCDLHNRLAERLSTGDSATRQLTSVRRQVLGRRPRGACGSDPLGSACETQLSTSLSRSLNGARLIVELRNQLLTSSQRAVGRCSVDTWHPNCWTTLRRRLSHVLSEQQAAGTLRGQLVSIRDAAFQGRAAPSQCTGEAWQNGCEQQIATAFLTLRERASQATTLRGQLVSIRDAAFQGRTTPDQCTGEVWQNGCATEITTAFRTLRGQASTLRGQASTLRGHLVSIRDAAFQDRTTPAQCTGIWQNGCAERITTALRTPCNQASDQVRDGTNGNVQNTEEASDSDTSSQSGE